MSKPIAAVTLALKQEGEAWTLYTGAPVWRTGDDGKQYRLVIDLATLEASGETVKMLVEHDLGTGSIGHWSGIQITESGVTGVPHVLERPEDDESMLWQARVAATLREKLNQGIPLEASVGVYPDREDYRETVHTSPLEANGRVIDATEENPVLFMENGLLREASIVEFGADYRTGGAQLSRHEEQHPEPKEESMDRMKALLAKHGKDKAGSIALLAAEGKTDEEISESLAAEDMEELRSQVASLSEQVSTLTTEKADLEAKLAAMAEEEDEAPAGGGDTATLSDGGESKVTMLAARKEVFTANPHLTGARLTAAVVEKYPHLKGG